MNSNSIPVRFSRTRRPFAVASFFGTLFFSCVSRSQSTVDFYVDSGAFSNGTSCGVGEIFVLPPQNVEKDTETPKAVFGVYPNPAQGKLQLVSDEKLRQVDCYDLAGRLMLHCEVANDNSVDVSQLTNGQYLLIADNNPNYSAKIIKK